MDLSHSGLTTLDCARALTEVFLWGCSRRMGVICIRREWLRDMRLSSRDIMFTSDQILHRTVYQGEERRGTGWDRWTGILRDAGFSHAMVYCGLSDDRASPSSGSAWMLGSIAAESLLRATVSRASCPPATVFLIHASPSKNL